MSFDENLSGAERELIAILGHGAVDDITAPGSTCPWSATECTQYVTVLRDFQTIKENTSYRIAVIARLWRAVAHARHINSYGLPNARLDRLQGLIDYTLAECSFNMAIGGLAISCIFIIMLRQVPALFDSDTAYDRRCDLFFLDLLSTWLKMYSPFIAAVLCLIATFSGFPMML